MLPRVNGVFTIGVEPNLRYTPSGVALCDVRAVASSRKQVDGEWVDDKSAWVNIICFKQLAENVAESVTKGDKIVVEGRLSVEPWEDKDGNQRIAVKVIADTVGPALDWATARVTKAQRSENSGGGQQQAQRSSGPPPDDDPWATPPQSDEPPF